MNKNKLPYKPMLQEMIQSVSETLHSTGEFDIIEPNYRFNKTGQNQNGALNKQAQRHVYCSMKEDLSNALHTKSRAPKPYKFLINMHHEEMNAKDYSNKLIVATLYGIHTGNILYRYINSTKDKSTHGPLFRRFVLDEDKKQNAQYHENDIYNQHSLLFGNVRLPERFQEDYEKKQNSEQFGFYLRDLKKTNKLTQGEKKLINEDMVRINSFRKLRNFEKDHVKSSSYNNMLLYFQAESKRLNKCIKRYDFNNVKRKEYSKWDNLIAKEAKQVFEPVDIETIKYFSMHPQVKNDQRKNYARQLLKTINKKSKKPINYNFPDQFLLADIIRIPDMEINTTEELIFRHHIGQLARDIRLNNVDNKVLLGIINEQSSKIDPDNELIKHKKPLERFIK